MSAAHRLGRYEIVAALGKGARSTVYRGQDPESKRAVAVKVIRRESLAPGALERFRAKAGDLARIDHPGISRFLEIVETENKVCVVSALAEGQPLSTLLKDGACPEPRIAWDIVRQMLEALAAAHAQGAVHGDLKPSNVMLAPGGRVTILDFGTSGLYGAAGETVHYFAPEHFGSAALTPRSDIYQAGVFAYQLVTGKLPFTGTPAEIAHRVAQERPADPSSFNNKLAWQLDWVVQKALAKAPADRYGAAVDLGDGLRLGLEDTVGRTLDPAKAPEDAMDLLSPLDDLVPPAAAETPAPSRTKPLPAPSAPPADNMVRNSKFLAAAARAPAPAAADSGRPTVLFVDDDPRILTGLVALFRQEYRALSAESGEAALAIIRAGAPHVLVTDQRMPGMTGVELLRKAREIAPNTVRILLTGYSDLAALVGSINQGEIFRFVKKPWDNDELRTALADATKIALELAGKAPPKPQSPRTAGSLLVIEAGSGLARGLQRLLAGTASVRSVASPQEAAKVLATEEIACIVADMGSGMDGLVALFRELKAKRPEVLSILLTDEPDSELAIELINRAQIFRFLPKPVNAKELRTQVAAALRRYAAFKAIPTLEAALPSRAPPGPGTVEREPCRSPSRTSPSCGAPS
jgi:serine/threonine-protein kinase